VYPTFDTIKPLPGMSDSPETLRYTTHEPVNLVRSIKDTLTKGGL